jgi:hypothetical protein
MYKMCVNDVQMQIEIIFVILSRLLRSYIFTTSSSFIIPQP